MIMQSTFSLKSKLLTLLLSVCVSILVFEAGLRVFGVQYPYFTYFTEVDIILG